MRAPAAACASLASESSFLNTTDTLHGGDAAFVITEGGQTDAFDIHLFEGKLKHKVLTVLIEPGTLKGFSIPGITQSHRLYRAVDFTVSGTSSYFAGVFVINSERILLLIRAVLQRSFDISGQTFQTVTFLHCVGPNVWFPGNGEQ